MMSGKTLNTLVKRAIELVKEATQPHPEVHLNVHVSWFGNELVGELGIAQNPNWPFDGRMATGLTCKLTASDI